MKRKLLQTLAAFVAGIALLGGVGLSGVPAAAATIAPNGPSGSWNLVFDDEFTGPTLDSTKWSTGWFGSGITGTANSAEKSCHNPENVWQSKGVLKLRAKTQQERCGNLTQSYSTALINTNGKFSFGYGYAESRIYVPSANDDSIANWPAWWTTGQAPWPNTGENDIFEGLGGHAEVNYHYLLNGAHASLGGPVTNKSYIGWHTFGSDRQAGVTKYYYDGVLVKTVNVGSNDPHFLILNNTIGDYGGALGVPSTLQVDYTRVWTNSGTSTTAPTPTPTPTANVTPATILNIGPGAGQNHFSVQTAPVGATAVQTHTQAEIAAGYSEDPVFVPSADKLRVQFQTRLDAATTSANTAYARSELRELTPSGDNYGFDYATGTHYIRGTSKVTHLPPNKPSVMVAQVHDATSDRLAIKTVLLNGTLQVVGMVNGATVTPTLDTSYVVGETFDWMIKIVNGTGYIYFNDMTTPAITAPLTSTSPAGTADWYYKAGSYNLSNETTDSSTEYISVELSRLQHWHTGWPAPIAIPGVAPVPTGGPVVTPTPTPTSTTPPPTGTVYPLHTNIVTTTFWVGEIFNASLSDGSQVCSTYDSQWAFSHTGINKWPSTDTGCGGSPVGGCDGPSSGSTYATFKCTTESRTAANDYFPKTQPIPKENPFYLDLPYDDLNDSTAYKERCTVIPWANADNAATGKNNCANSSYSYMKNRWVKITGPNGKTCYGQNEDAGPSSGSLYHDKAYVFGTTDARPRNTQFSGDPSQGAGMDVSPALNGCLGFVDLDGDTDHIKWQWVDRASVPAGPWTKVITTSQVRN